MGQGRALTNQGPWEADFLICLMCGLMLDSNTGEKFSLGEEKCQGALEGLIFYSLTWGIGRKRGNDYSLQKAALQMAPESQPGNVAAWHSPLPA